MKDIWEWNETILLFRRHAIWILKIQHQLDERVTNLNYVARFGHLLKLGNMKINHLLVTTLAERRRTKTYTFHLPLDATIITLEDVALQLGLPIDRESVNGLAMDH